MYSRWYVCNCFDLDQEVLDGQTSHFEQGTCRGIGRAYILCSDLAKDGQLGTIENIDIQFDHMGKIRLNGSKRGLEILEDLLCLGTKIMQTDDISIRVEGKLASDKNGPSVCHLDYMGITRRCR